MRLDGTGGILQTDLLRFNPASGLVEAQSLGQYYKGFMQINGRQLTFFQANYLPDEPNCCPSGVERYVFAWNGATFRARPRRGAASALFDSIGAALGARVRCFTQGASGNTAITSTLT